MVDDLRHGVGIEQLHAIDELEVGAEDGDELAAGGPFAGLLGESRHDGISEGERQARLGGIAVGAHDNLSALGGNAGGGVDANHIIAYKLEVGDLQAAGKFNLFDIVETRAVDGDWQVGDNLRGEEHLDAQAYVGRLVFVFGTGRENGTDKNHGEQRA